MASKPQQTRRHAPAQPSSTGEFDIDAYLTSAGASRTVAQYSPGETVFSQGDLATDVLYIQEGRVKLTVLSRGGKEAVVAILNEGEFFGEGALAGQHVRIETATALGDARVLVIARDTTAELLRSEPTFAARFIAHMLTRHIRIEADLVDQLFNSSEKRLARALLLMSHYGQPDAQRTLPRISQETLAEIVGTTRARVNYFMNKFRDLGLIEYNGTIKVNDSLLSVVLHD